MKPVSILMLLAYIFTSHLSSGFHINFLEQFLKPKHFSVLLNILPHFYDRLLEKCEKTTQFNYWTCNERDLKGILQDPVHHRFNSSRMNSSHQRAAVTPDGAFVFALFGASLAQIVHENCVLNNKLECTRGCQGGQEQAWDNLTAAHNAQCAAANADFALDMSRVFARKYEQHHRATNQTVAAVAAHNMQVGHAFFLKYVHAPNLPLSDDNPFQNPCPCMSSSLCYSPKWRCYHIHNTPGYRAMEQDLAPLLYTRVERADSVLLTRTFTHRDGRVRRVKLYQSSNSPITSKKMAYLDFVEPDCSQLNHFTCLRRQSYERCAADFLNVSSWMQKLMKQSCNICRSCGMRISSSRDPHLRECPESGEISKIYTCS